MPVGTSAVTRAPWIRFSRLLLLGTRYWISERFGFELGLGFMIKGGNIKDSRGGEGGDVRSRAFAFNAGLPIALAWGKHYNILAIPYVGMGFSKATDGRGRRRDLQ